MSLKTRRHAWNWSASPAQWQWSASARDSQQGFQPVIFHCCRLNGPIPPTLALAFVVSLISRLALFEPPILIVSWAVKTARSKTHCKNRTIIAYQPDRRVAALSAVTKSESSKLSIPIHNAHIYRCEIEADARESSMRLPAASVGGAHASGTTTHRTARGKLPLPSPQLGQRVCIVRFVPGQALSTEVLLPTLFMFCSRARSNLNAMREYLRDIREVQTADYLSQVINEVVPLERDVSSLSHVCSLCERMA